MGRVVSFAVVAVSGALGLAGCGAATTATDSVGLRLTGQPPTGGTAAVEPTDGRLGDASAIRAGSPLRELSPGGRLDVRSRGKLPRRDGVGARAACANPDLAPRAETLGAMVAATLCLLNRERADHGLAPLATNGKLTAAANAYAQDLVAGSYFSHTGRDGSGLSVRIERSGYLPPDAGWTLGENLAWGTGALATPGSIMRAWMNSPGHRENILNPDYREIGVGVVTGNPAQRDGLGATYATEFGEIDEIEPVASHRRRAAHRARRARKRARRHVKARNSLHVRRGKRHGRRAKARALQVHVAV